MARGVVGAEFAREAGQRVDDHQPHIIVLLQSLGGGAEVADGVE